MKGSAKNEIAICDDELCETMKLSQTIHSLFIEAKRPVPSIRLFTSAEELLENVEKKRTLSISSFSIFSCPAWEV